MKKIHKREIISKILIIIAICLLSYPAIAEIYNKYHSSYVIKLYRDSIKEISGEDDYKNILEEVRKYNESLENGITRYFLSEEQQEKYMSLLNISDNGVMGIISIPKINVKLPIYHTAEEKILQVAVGHIPGTSLPVGGKGTHAVLSGHRGLASAAIFTNLPKLEIGDTFNIEVLNEVLTYEVDKIDVVSPTDIKNIEIVDGEDYCTLLTCTPLGINSHRLLVRGHRIETIYEEESDAGVLNEVVKGHVLTFYEVIMLIIAIILFIVGIFLTLKRSRAKRKNNSKKPIRNRNMKE